jgi:hypothetical protein
MSRALAFVVKSASVAFCYVKPDKSKRLGGQWRKVRLIIEKILSATGTLRFTRLIAGPRRISA